MQINLHTFILLYIGILCFIPIILLQYIKFKQCQLKLFFNIWSFIYTAIALALTLLNASVSKTFVGFNIPTNHSFFEFNHADGMNTHNLIINFALVIPLGVITFYRYIYTYKNMIHNIRPLPLRYNPVFVGLLFAVIIELLQGVLPTGRFVDPSDLVFDSLFTLLSFAVCWLYNIIIQNKIKKTFA